MPRKSVFFVVYGSPIRYALCNLYPHSHCVVPHKMLPRWSASHHWRQLPPMTHGEARQGSAVMTTIFCNCPRVRAWIVLEVTMTEMCKCIMIPWTAGNHAVCRSASTGLGSRSWANCDQIASLCCNLQAMTCEQSSTLVLFSDNTNASSDWLISKF